MAHEAMFAVSGYVATQPVKRVTKNGTVTLSMRVAWTPRVIDKATGDWTDQETSFVSVTCFRKVAENAAKSLRRGDAIVLRGTLKVREYTDQAGVKRSSVDVVADSIGHDMAKGTSHYTKGSQHAEQTAEEYQSSTAAERQPLPGDVAALGGASGQAASMLDPAEQAQLAVEDDAEDEPDAAELPDLPDLPDPESEQPDVELAGSRRGRR
jgi:single-strand DNA-binding protein